MFFFRFARILFNLARSFAALVHHEKGCLRTVLTSVLITCLTTKKLLFWKKVWTLVLDF